MRGDARKPLLRAQSPRPAPRIVTRSERRRPAPVPRPWHYRGTAGRGRPAAQPGDAHAARRPRLASRATARRESRPDPARFMPRVGPRRPAPIFVLGRRGEPIYDGQELRLRSDGRWHYRGPGGTFSATVGQDGSLAFRDHRSVGAPDHFRPQRGAPARDPSARVRAAAGALRIAVLRFDVTDALMRSLGQDPYAAEKLRFARATEAWRARLRSRWQQRRDARATRRIRHLGRVCRRYRRATPTERRRIRSLIFAWWDETREDRRGRALRAALHALVRTCPVSYPAAELARLNARRESRQPFRPTSPQDGRFGSPGAATANRDADGRPR